MEALVEKQLSSLFGTPVEHPKRGPKCNALRCRKQITRGKPGSTGQADFTDYTGFRLFQLKAYQTNIPPSKSFFRYSKLLIAICLFFYFFYQPNIGKRF